MSKIIQNAAYCMECGEIVISTHVHDFKECSCGNIWVDGGTDYLRMGGVGFMNNSYFDLSIHDTDKLKQSPFDFYENFLWGTRGINGDEPLTYVFIKDLTKEHLYNILLHVEKISEYHKQAMYYWLYKNFGETINEVTKHFEKLKETKNNIIDKFWYDEDRRLHREDGPAIEWVNGDKWWYIHGVRHREDGPAVEFADGNADYFLYGNQITKEQFDFFKSWKRS